jgi:U3 small nucleolar RNA-associated protein 7
VSNDGQRIFSSTGCVTLTLESRHLAIASAHGHVATFDWQAGRLHSEMQLKESVRDIK